MFLIQEQMFSHILCYLWLQNF